MVGKGAATLNGEPLDVPMVRGSYLDVEREWRDADTLALTFPAALSVAPLNDKHAWHNATLAYMYGPLVLAGVDVSSDIFVPPAGQTVQQYIVRNTSASGLEFVASAADGSTMRMLPLRDVMDEQYVAYFYTAGTKPPQPRVVYCPHSAGAAHAHDGHNHDDGHGHDDVHGHDDGHGHGSAEDEAALISEGAPPAPPVGSAGRGVRWAVDPAGQMLSLAP